MNIIAFPVDDGGCGWYRVRQPLKLLRELTEHDTHVMDQQKDDFVEVAKALPRAHVWLLRQGSHKALNDVIDKYDFLQNANPLRVVDLDDHVLEVSPFSSHYDEWGTKEVWYGDKKLWENGVAGFDVKTNKKRVKYVTESYKDADLLIVTTQRLKDVTLQWNKNIEIFPNMINFQWWWPIEGKPNRKLRIGWSGGSSHYEDLYTIRQPINRIMREFDVEFWNTGSYFKGIFDKDNQHRVVVRPWVDFNGHSYHMMSQQLDIAIAPLKDMEFNYYKSPIKFLEYSAMKVPTVAAKIPPYSDIIKNEKTGMLYNTPEEFYKAVLRLIEAPYARKNLAENAYKFVKGNYDARKRAGDLAIIYQNAIDRRNGKNKNNG